MKKSDTRTHNVVKAGLPGWHVKEILLLVCLLLPICCCPQYRLPGRKPVWQYHRYHAEVLPHSFCTPLTCSATLVAASSLSTVLHSLQRGKEVTGPLAILSLYALLQLVEFAGNLLVHHNQQKTWNAARSFLDCIGKSNHKLAQTSCNELR